VGGDRTQGKCNDISVKGGVKMKFLIIDNYDSFVYNIAQLLGELNVESDVIRNDKITIDDIKNGNYDAIIISPGPGTPEDEKYFGICTKVIKELGPTKPILGVCLGHQGIIHAFGGKVVNAGNVRHGKTSSVEYTPSPLFEGVQNPFRATRYHSLVGDKTIIPDDLKVTAVAQDDKEIMAISHKKYIIEGVQFHPESIMTTEGKKILSNFIKLVQK
jgi:anthranilate synthase component 2